MNRRLFLGLTALFAVPGLSRAAEGGFEVTRGDAEWREMLTPLQFEVMRRDGTEPAFNSPLHDLEQAGTYHCRGCNLPVYPSEAKFDSGTGWPSFTGSLDGAIGTRPDRKLFAVRTECHCRRCGSHLGHIFDDGPPPTGKRHCLNGVSLVFVAG